MDKIDISIKELKKQYPKGLISSELILEFSGNSVNKSLINALRRIGYEYVPTYAFTDETITIDSNTSIFNNDYMKLRLKQFTIPNVPIETNYLDPEYYVGVDYTNPNRIKHPKDNSLVEMYVNAKNTGNQIMNVTTNNAEVFINGDKQNKFDKEYPLLIVQLRPEETFNCRCVAVLGVGLINHVWSSLATSYFKEINENKFHLHYKSCGQLSEYDVVLKSAKILKKKIKSIKKKIDEEFDKDEIAKNMDMELVLENENHTVGNIINESLQDHKKVASSGLSKKNLLIETIYIHFILFNEKDNPLTVLYDVFDYIIAVSNVIKEKVTKLSK